MLLSTAVSKTELNLGQCMTRFIVIIIIIAVVIVVMVIIYAS